MTETDYRIALRPDDNGHLDDVVVKDVTMFRAEMMDDKTLWLACYLDNETHDRITFWVSVQRGKLHFDFTETPQLTEVVYEPGSIGAPQTNIAGEVAP